MYIDRDIGYRINEQVSLHLTTKNLKTIDVEVIDIREISHWQDSTFIPRFCKILKFSKTFKFIFIRVENESIRSNLGPIA